MAKQSGIHQLRGKVGEMSYYRTKGVQAGVVRRINQGMSQRVKAGDEFVNTRRNNAEFKNANAIATAAFNSVADRKRGMMRNFAVAEMTKRALEDIKQGTGSWGLRMPATHLDKLICDMLENYSKGGKYDGRYGIVGDASLGADGNFIAKLNISSQKVGELKSLGVDGLFYVVSRGLAGESIVDSLPHLFAGSFAGIVENKQLVLDEDIEVTLGGSVSTPANVGMSSSGYTFAREDEKHGFYLCVTIIPYRIVGSAKYNLQELSTFVAIPLGQIPK